MYKRTIIIVEVACAWDPIVAEREAQKRSKYKELAGDLAHQWPQYRVTNFHVVIGTLGLNSRFEEGPPLIPTTTSTFTHLSSLQPQSHLYTSHPNIHKHIYTLLFPTSTSTFAHLSSQHPQAHLPTSHPYIHKHIYTSHPYIHKHIYLILIPTSTSTFPNLSSLHPQAHLPK